MGISKTTKVTLTIAILLGAVAAVAGLLVSYGIFNGAHSVDSRESCTPSPEICDGIDNDCDGLADDNLTRSCWSGSSGFPDVGLCRAGRQTCTDGSYGVCVGEILPTVEIPDNGLDEDCNGVVLTSPLFDVRAVDRRLTSSVLAGSSCGRVGDHTLTITVDDQRLDALFGACPEGRRIGTWDQCGEYLFSTAGASSLIVEGAIVGGYYMAMVQCGGRIHSWPDSSLSRTAISQGFSNIAFDGVELAGGSALICHDVYSDPMGTSSLFNRLAIPTNSEIRGECPGAH